MKKIIVLSLLLLVAGCTAQDDSRNTSELDTLSQEFQSLKDENNQLKQTNAELRTLIDEYKSELDQVITTSDAMKKKIEVLDERHLEVRALNQLTYRMLHYISKIPSYSEITCYIHSYDIEKNTIMIDDFEWVSMDDYDRIEELDLDPDHDFPNGYFIYNKEEKAEKYYLPMDTRFYVFDKNFRLIYANQEMFSDRLNDYMGLFGLVLIDNEIVEVSEIYVP